MLKDEGKEPEIAYYYDPNRMYLEQMAYMVSKDITYKYVLAHRCYELEEKYIFD